MSDERTCSACGKARPLFMGVCQECNDAPRPNALQSALDAARDEVAMLRKVMEEFATGRYGSGAYDRATLTRWITERAREALATQEEKEGGT